MALAGHIRGRTAEHVVIDDPVESPPTCTGCGREIDPDCCWCGEDRPNHENVDPPHSFTPAGCECGRQDGWPPPPHIPRLEYRRGMSDDEFQRLMQVRRAGAHRLAEEFLKVCAEQERGVQGRLLCSGGCGTPHPTCTVLDGSASWTCPSCHAARFGSVKGVTAK